MLEIQPITLNDVFALSSKLSGIIKEIKEVEVQENMSVMVLSNLEKFMPVLPIFTNGQLSEEDIRKLSLKEVVELVDRILEINEIDQVVGLFQQIAKKVQPSVKK
ncbi:MAG: hypothetical protein ACO3TG_00340 [Minisyncoccia bacterium]